MALERLNEFTGTETWYQHNLMTHVKYTEGAKYLAEEGKAWWFLDTVATHQAIPKLKEERFQVWKLDVYPDKKATITVEDGNANQLAQFRIPYTDFDERNAVLWCVDNIILLPTEY
jgi:uncharacterized protein DUF6876